ncbi:hypothetical protein BS47DRAFT_545232 [Hydnum rufescens UP504]|uniref:Uncharacterized protein n=1 Tax=Hydnum rufescens UP504 TaxID=1448309 RepID=A0A9P6B434_9AGAM|nr:hypothetical protein BS47DRAFT_545232 [Hydnum rufescens UP504]
MADSYHPFRSLFSDPTLRFTCALLIPTTAHGPDPKFLKECASALGLCDGIIRFVSPSFEPLSPRILFDGLRNKAKLQAIKLDAALDKDHATMLVSLTRLREINLERPSDPVISLLPMWIPNLSSLTTISLSHSGGINRGILGMILSATPRLLSLSVRKCWQLRLHHIFETVAPACPSLEYLCIHTEEGITMPRLPPSIRLYHLRHLKIDAGNREDNLGLTPGFHDAWNYSLGRLYRPSRHQTPVC